MGWLHAHPDQARRVNGMLDRLPPPKGPTDAGMRAAKAALLRADMIFSCYGVLPHPDRPVAILRGQIGAPDLEGREITVSRVRAFAREARYKTQATILLASNGGDTRTTAEICKLLEPLSAGLTVKAIGRVDSAGIDILMMGARRECVPAASFFLHRGAHEPGGRWTAARHRAIAAELDRDDHGAAHLIARRTGQPIARIARMMETETRVFATEALRLGLVHEVTR